MAYRTGAAVSDMEFYQFHPTAFSAPGAPRFLLSEALRGEGAILINAKGERFMERYHPLLELAPRDVVARAITREGMDGPVYLDMRHVKKDLRARVPGMSAFLAKYQLQLGRDLIPVRPAAHYLMGGVKTDVQGRTSLPGLYAAGEVACTGVHGANRLASNSLLEALVVAHRPLGPRAGAVMLWCVAGFGLFTIVFGLSQNVVLSVAALLMVGACDMVSVIVRHTLVQVATPDDMRGRVSAVNSIFIGASNEVGQFESGITAAWLGATRAVVLGGVGTILVVAAWWRMFPELHRTNRLQPKDRG